MRYLILALSLVLCPLTSAHAEVSFSMNIGINVPVYPRFVRVPGYPVYYAPQANLNYFFYDGLYWIYQDDNWYSSEWYNGPWDYVMPEDVPLYILRVPVRYYLLPPMYFRNWHNDAPPRWGEYWGRDWEERRSGWDHWDKHAAPRPAPLPGYQRQYSGERYPREPEQQHSIRSEQYRYQPREEVTQQRFQQQDRPDRPYAEPHQQPRIEQQQQVPVQQRPVTPQQHSQPNTQRQQQPQPMQRQQQPQPVQQPQQMQRPQAAPQDMGRDGGGRDNRGRDGGRDNRNEDRGQDRR